MMVEDEIVVISESDGELQEGPGTQCCWDERWRL